MIKYKANAAKTGSIFSNGFRCRGKLGDLLTETTFLINCVYCFLAKHNEEVADSYKRLIIKTVSDERSPIWNRYDIKGEKNAHS